MICHLCRSEIVGVVIYYPEACRKVQTISLSDNFQFAQSKTYLINIHITNTIKACNT